MHIDLDLYRQDVWTRDGVRLSVIDVQLECP